MIHAEVSRTQGVREVPCVDHEPCGYIHHEPDGNLTIQITITGPREGSRRSNRGGVSVA